MFEFFPFCYCNGDLLLDYIFFNYIDILTSHAKEYLRLTAPSIPLERVFQLLATLMLGKEIIRAR